MFSAASKSASGGTLITQTFTSNTTWVAPTTTGYLVSAVGYGSTATADTFNSNLPIGNFGPFPTGGTGRTNPPFAQWANVYSALGSAESTIAGNSGTNLVSFTVSARPYFIGTDDTWNDLSVGLSYWIQGSSYTTIPTGSPPTSGNITYASLGGSFKGWSLFAPGYDLGSAGTATTGFSKTFPGGTLTGTTPFRTAVAPVTTTFTNIPVTPGASYSIVVPSGGSLTITYIG
jgi:hypothetical protein